MARRKKNKKNREDIEHSSRLKKAGKIIVLLLIGFGVGWGFGFVAGQQNAESAASQSSDSEASTDSYGRSPGDPHYGHRHP